MFELERAPLIILDADTDGEFARLVDWISSHPEIQAVYDAAYELDGEWR